jgi:hypothetical protein
MSSVAVGVANIVDLEPERVLQVVARLLLGESGDDGRSLRDVDDHQAASVRQAGSDFLYPGCVRYVVSALAEVELRERTDVA